MRSTVIARRAEAISIMEVVLQWREGFHLLRW
jgi:hypothetical protein